MKRSILGSVIALSILATSCVSKKKFADMEGKYDNSQSELYKTRTERDEYKDKLDDIEARVSEYNNKISALQDENEEKIELDADGHAVSEKAKKAMRKTLENVDPDKLAEAKTLGDSLDLAVSYNLTKSLTSEEAGEDDLDIDVDQTVVKITVSDKLLFGSGSYYVNPDANSLLGKISKVVNSEEAMEVMVEGHTDAQTVVDSSYIKDNWDLSVRRATAVVRILEDKYDVDGEQLIASGRSSYKAIADNESTEGRAKNRRTRIIILPNLNKFLAMLDENYEGAENGNDSNLDNQDMDNQRIDN